MPDEDYEIDSSGLWDKLKEFSNRYNKYNGYYTIKNVDEISGEITANGTEVFDNFFPPLTKFLAASEDFMNIAPGFVLADGSGLSIPLICENKINVTEFKINPASDENGGFKVRVNMVDKKTICSILTLNLYVNKEEINNVINKSVKLYLNAVNECKEKLL